MKKVTNYLLWAVLLLGLITGCGGSYEFGPYMGKIVDKETGKPIEGAVVFMQFFTSSPNPGGSTSHFADAVEVLTDPNGEFLIPEQHLAVYKFLRGWEKNGSVIIFKPGYGAFPRHPDAGPKFMPSYSIPENKYVTIALPKLESREERIDNQSKASFTSKIPFEKWKKLFELRNEERISIGLKPFKKPQ